MSRPEVAAISALTILGGLSRPIVSRLLNVGPLGFLRSERLVPAWQGLRQFGAVNNDNDPFITATSVPRCCIPCSLTPQLHVFPPSPVPWLLGNSGEARAVPSLMSIIEPTKRLANPASTMRLSVISCWLQSCTQPGRVSFGNPEGVAGARGS